MGCGNSKSKNSDEIYKSNFNEDQNNNEDDLNIENKESKKDDNLSDESIENSKKTNKINHTTDNNNKNSVNNQDYKSIINDNSSSNISNEEMNIENENNNNNNEEQQININDISENETTSKNSQSYYTNVSESSLITINSSIQNEVNSNNLTNRVDNFSIIKENNYFSIIIKPYLYDTVLPIWCEKNTDIIFRVYGKWSIDEYTECDCKGIESENISKEKFNNGALIGRILNSSYFLIYDNLHYVSYTRGPLYFKMNVNNIFNKTKPNGELNLKIFGVKNLSYEEIDELLGWDKSINEIIYTNQSLYSNISIPILEKETIIYVNKMRVNSTLFAKEYLENIKNLTVSIEKLYKYMTKENNVKYEKLKVNPFILNKIQEFYFPILGKNNKNKNKNYNILNSEIELENYLTNVFGKLKRIKLIIKKHNSFKPLTLAIRFLLDENIRNEIFTSKNSEISILTLKSKKFKKITLYSIIVFSEDKLENSLYFANILDSVKEKTVEQNNNNNNNNNSGIVSINDNLETIKEENDSNKTIKKAASEKICKSDMLANRIILDENMDPDILEDSSYLSGIKIGNLQDY